MVSAVHRRGHHTELTTAVDLLLRTGDFAHRAIGVGRKDQLEAVTSKVWDQTRLLAEEE